MHQNPELLPVGPLDLVLAVPPFPGANFMDFDHHFEVFEAAYQWCRSQIDEHRRRRATPRLPRSWLPRIEVRNGRRSTSNGAIHCPTKEKPRRSGAK